MARLSLAPMPHQVAALTDLMSRTDFDAIINDVRFFGVLPFLLGDPAASTRTGVLHNSAAAEQPRHRSARNGAAPAGDNAGATT